ncbi:MAG: hypothetical protein GXP25_16760 [Planctomycetes bacterium]|nr:hypothetical protein [Planctomycetota bacterium]
MPRQRAIQAKATDTVLFLVKNEFITGQVIYVDGRSHIGRLSSGSGVA